MTLLKCYAHSDCFARQSSDCRWRPLPHLLSRSTAHSQSRKWIEKKFATKIVVDATEYSSPTHLIDCFKGRVALELEWNNKDPFFDRDLNNFRPSVRPSCDRRWRRSHAAPRSYKLSSTSVARARAMAIARRTTRNYGPGSKAGGGGGCPVLTFAITPRLYVDDGPEALEAALRAKAERDERRKTRKIRKLSGEEQPDNR